MLGDPASRGAQEGDAAAAGVPALQLHETDRPAVRVRAADGCCPLRLVRLQLALRPGDTEDAAELGWRTGQPAEPEQLAVLREDPEDGARHLVEQHRPRIGTLADRGIPGAEELAGGAGRREHPSADQALTRPMADAVGGPQALAHAVLRAQPRAVSGAPVPGPVEQLAEPGADELVVEQVVASRQDRIRGQGDRCLGGAAHGSPSVVPSGAASRAGSAAVVRRRRG